MKFQQIRRNIGTKNLHVLTTSFKLIITDLHINNSFIKHAYLVRVLNRRLTTECNDDEMRKLLTRLLDFIYQKDMMNQLVLV